VSYDPFENVRGIADNIVRILDGAPQSQRCRSSAIEVPSATITADCRCRRAADR
jgi:hypothetical protein